MAIKKLHFLKSLLSEGFELIQKKTMFENIKLIQKRLLSYNPSSASYYKTN